MRLGPLKPGQRVTARDHEEIRRQLRMLGLRSAGGGGTVFQSPGGTAFTAPAKRQIPVFLIRKTDEGAILAKEPFLKPYEHGVWHIPNIPRYIVGWPYPGYSVKDYEPYFLQIDTKIGPEDHAVTFDEPYFKIPSTQRVGYKLVTVTIDLTVVGGLKAQERPVGQAAAGEPFDARPWPGYSIWDYEDKEDIIMLALRFGPMATEQLVYAFWWYVLMTGDRVYARWPSDFCQACVPTP